MEIPREIDNSIEGSVFEYDWKAAYETTIHTLVTEKERLIAALDHFDAKWVRDQCETDFLEWWRRARHPDRSLSG